MDVYSRRRVLESNMATLQVKVAQLKRKDVLLIARQKHLRLRFLKVMAADTIPDSSQTRSSVGDKISKADVSHGTDNPSSRSNIVINNPSTKCNNVTHKPSSRYIDVTKSSSRYDVTDNLSSRYNDVTDKSCSRYSDVTDKSSSRYSGVTDKSSSRYSDVTKLSSRYDVTDNLSSRYNDVTDKSCSRYSDVTDNSSSRYSDVTKLSSRYDVTDNLSSRYNEVTDKSSPRYSDVTDKSSQRYSNEIPERSSCYTRITDASSQEYTIMQRCRYRTSGSNKFSDEASRSSNVKGFRDRGQDARAFKLKKYRSTPVLNHMSHRDNNPDRPELRTTYDLQPSHCLRNRQYHSMDNSYRYTARSREITNNAPNATSASYDSSSSDSNYGPGPERDSGDEKEYGRGFLSRRSSGYESDATSSNGDDHAGVPTLRRAVSVACVQGRQPILNILLSDRVKCSWC